MTVTLDVAAFRTFKRAGWESDGKATNDAAAWGPITSRAVDCLLDAAGARSDRHVLDLASGPGYVSSGAGGRGAAATGVEGALQYQRSRNTFNTNEAFLATAARSVRV